MQSEIFKAITRLNVYKYKSVKSQVSEIKKKGWVDQETWDNVSKPLKKYVKWCKEMQIIAGILICSKIDFFLVVSNFEG